MAGGDDGGAEGVAAALAGAEEGDEPPSPMAEPQYVWPKIKAAVRLVSCRMRYSAAEGYYLGHPEPCRSG